MKAIVLYFIILTAFLPDLIFAQNCSVSIKSPVSNATINTAQEIEVKGTAVNLPKGSHVWVLTARVGLNRWYPQGDGERNLNEDGSWDCIAYLGQPKKDYGKYNVAVVVVNAEVNKELNDWVKHPTNEAGDYVGIFFPTVMEGCSIKTIVVEKK